MCYVVCVCVCLSVGVCLCECLFVCTFTHYRYEVTQFLCNTEVVVGAVCLYVCTCKTLSFSSEGLSSTTSFKIHVEIKPF